MAKSGDPHAIPRRWRLPNPPAVFRGRDAEQLWLRDALARAPVSVVAGPTGIGKTALAIATVAADPAARALMIAAASTEPAEQTAIEVVRALAQVLGRAVELGPLQSSFDARVDALLELASAWRGVVLVDGLATHGDESERWLHQLAAYAEGTSFLITGRAAPRDPRLDGQVLVLGPLELGVTRELAAAWAPEVGPDAHVRAARRAHGHPGELQRVVRGETQPRPLDAALERLLRLMTAAGLPLGERALDVLGSPAEREALVASGALRRIADTFEPWSDALALEPLTTDELEQAATRLLLLGGTEATLAALALLARAGAHERLHATLDERGPALLDQGYAARLFAALSVVGSAALDAWQLRCAEQLGNPTALARAHEPEHGPPAERLLWARALLARGHPRDAHTIAAAVAALGGRLAVDAACVAAEAAARAGWPDAAAAVLAAVEPADALSSARLGVAHARWSAERGDSARSLGALASELSRLGADEETWCGLAHALARRGELDAALRALDAVDALPRGSRPELLTSRAALLVRASISVEQGEPELARELAEIVRPFAREPSALAAPRDACELEARWLLGDLEGLEGRLALAFERARDRDALTERRLRGLDARVRWARGEPPRERADTPEAAAWHARWGAPAVAPPAPADRRNEVWAPMIAACAALASGRVAEALAAAERALAEADRWGLPALSLEACSLWGEAMTVAGELRTVGPLASRLAERAAACRSARAERHARFFALVGAARVDPASAELLAADADIAPAVARWAQAALGGTPPLDHADRALMAALSASGALPRVRVVGPPSPPGAPPSGLSGWAPTWGLDLSRQHAWTPRGERVELANRLVQWRILETLAKSEGLRADKETLVQSVWDVREYHPGHHDSRLHVAIRKLRAAIEDDPSAPERVVTTEEGYALGTPVRLAE